MTKNNEVVTFGDLYAMTSFLSNAELVLNIRTDIKNGWVDNFTCNYDISKLFIVINNESNSIMGQSSIAWPLTYYLITKNCIDTTFRLYWQAGDNVSNYRDIRFKRTGKNVNLIRETVNTPSYFIYLMIYEIP